MPTSQAFAILVLHRYDKSGFLMWIHQLDQLCQLIPNCHLYIYDLAVVDAEQLSREDLQQFHTPLRIVRGVDQSSISAYNRLLQMLPDDYESACLLSGFLPHLHTLRTIIGQLHNHSTLCINPDLTLFAVPTHVVRSIGLFEEQFFTGIAHYHDYIWRARHVGCRVRRQMYVGELVALHQSHVSPDLSCYYSIRNQWLFAYLRLPWHVAIWFILWIFIRDGICLGLVRQPAFWRGWSDGWKLFRCRFLRRSPIIHHDRKIS